jgi:NADPH2:quinone reductase
MKAIRVKQFGAPGEMRLAEVPVPQPEAGQVLVRIHAAGVNPVETYIRSGSYARKPELPYTPGSDGAGVVEAVGTQVTHYKPGDRVYTAGTITGSYAEYALCQAGQIHPLPDKVSFAQGAAVGVPYATAYRALIQRAGAVTGETVLVHGASGGVGLAAVQLGVAHGLKMWGTASTKAGRQLILDQGAQQVFDHGHTDYLEEIQQAAGKRGVEIILEMLANRNLGRDLPLLAAGGRVVVIGSRGKVEIDARDIMSRDADIRGMVLFNTPPADMARIHTALFTGMDVGTLRPVIAREFPLADAPQAHVAVMEPGATGKIILVP